MIKEPFWPWDEGYDGIAENDDWHDRVQHPVWHEGCADCVSRAEWIEVNR